MTIAYEFCGTLPDGTYKIKFTENPFSGIMFTLGGISFEETEGMMIMHYDYNVIEHQTDFDKQELDKAIGDLIIELIDDGVSNNSLVYTGGVDEN